SDQWLQTQTSGEVPLVVWRPLLVKRPAFLVARFPLDFYLYLQAATPFSSVSLLEEGKKPFCWARNLKKLSEDQRKQYLAFLQQYTPVCGRSVFPCYPLRGTFTYRVPTLALAFLSAGILSVPSERLDILLQSTPGEAAKRKRFAQKSGSSGRS
ncbi:hypothetical protein P7K49_008389, partial [Saguinus oedipus]